MVAVTAGASVVAGVGAAGVSVGALVAVAGGVPDGTASAVGVPDGVAALALAGVGVSAAVAVPDGGAPAAPGVLDDSGRVAPGVGTPDSLSHPAIPSARHAIRTAAAPGARCRAGSTEVTRRDVSVGDSTR